MHLLSRILKHSVQQISCSELRIAFRFAHGAQQCRFRSPPSTDHLALAPEFFSGMVYSSIPMPRLVLRTIVIVGFMLSLRSIRLKREFFAATLYMCSDALV